MSRPRPRPVRPPCAASGRRLLRPEVEDESEEKFHQTLSQFITEQTQYLQCPREGPSERRYLLYRSVFNKLISRSSTYKRILLCVKTEFDHVIRALSQRLEETQRAPQSCSHDALRAPQSCSHDALRAPQSCQSSILHKDTAATERRRSLRPRHMWTEGLTEARRPELLEEVAGELVEEVAEELVEEVVEELVEEVVDEEVEEEEVVEELRSRRAVLLEERSRSVDVEVRSRLEQEQEVGEKRRHEAQEENQQLKLLYKRLKCVCDSVRLWKKETQCCPLEDLLLSVPEQVTHITVTEEELGNEEAQDVEYLTKFVDLFDSAQYREAAQHAAHSPRGALRNLHTVLLFKAVPGCPPSPPPLLLLVQALLVSTPAGHSLPEDVSFEVVCCALEQGHWRLLTHALHFDKLSLSERLGDLLTAHAHRASGAHQAPHQSDPHQSDLHQSDLHQSDLHQSDLHQSDLHQSDLHQSDLHQSDLHQSDLHQSDLHQSDLHQSDLHQSDLHQSDLHQSDLHQSDLHQSDLHQSDLHQSDLHQSDLHQSDLHQSDLHQSDLHQSDLLMALASVCFRACGAHRSLALSLCSRGLLHSSVQLMRRELSAEEVLWVFGRYPSLRLLQLLTVPCEDGLPLLSVGEACVALLSAPHTSRTMLCSCSRDQPLCRGPSWQPWNHICALCSSLHPELSQALSTILLSQSGTARLSPDPEGARLTQHLYL